MKAAAVVALAELAKQPVTQEVLDAYGLDSLEFGREYILPKATDSRLLGAISYAVAKAAIDSGVARKDMPANYPLS
jgi:malate dehydrogenase (oxaloacetate-decarboxylating)(NADP+)